MSSSHQKPVRFNESSEIESASYEEVEGIRKRF